MARRADPERLYEARRAALVNRLRDQDRLPPDLVDVWVHAWEVEAKDRALDRGSAAFWDGARDWIIEQRVARRPPRVDIAPH